MSSTNPAAHGKNAERMEGTDEQRIRIQRVVEACLQAANPSGLPIPGEEEDWIDSGFLDSIAHVDVLVSIETALGAPDLLSRSGGPPPTTTRSAVALIERALSNLPAGEPAGGVLRTANPEIRRPATIAGWAGTLGSETVSAESVDKEFGLAPGTLRARAGIEQVSRASAVEDHVSLAESASRRALEMAAVPIHAIRWLVATSETFPGYPSLGASLHSSLLAAEGCNVLDVGGACVGLLNAFAVAKALLREKECGPVLVVSADLHSRALSPAVVPGQFGGLFGDGACAFVLVEARPDNEDRAYRLAPSIGGCDGAFSAALRIGQGRSGSLELNFDGEGLARAAVDRMTRIIASLELRSGIGREAAEAFALHQPNPRLLELILKYARLPADRVPLVAKFCGNLGSSTCGVALAKALDAAAGKRRGERGPIFVAAVGPGMLWGGMVLE